MAFEETSRHKSNSNMHTKLANQHFCKIPKNQADLHFIIFDVVVRIATCRDIKICFFNSFTYHAFWSPKQTYPITSDAKHEL